MKVVLVGPELEENLSLRYLESALLRAGHACSIVPCNRRREVARSARAVLARKPDLVGFSLVAQCRYPDFQELGRLLRAGGFRGHLTAGGHFAGLRAREVLADTPALDSILHHEGELRLAALASGLAAGSAARGEMPPDLDGVTWRTPAGAIEHRPALRVAGIDELAPPTRTTPQRTLGYARAPLVSSRGCAGACSFCSIHAWHRTVPQGRLRFRTPAAVAEEMVALYRERGVLVFVFHDDDFIHPDPRQALERCRRILGAARRGIGRPFAFVIKCRPDDVDEDLFRFLKAEGLARAYVGIETATEAGAQALNRRVRPETNERALALLRELGIYSCFNLLLFHPDSTLEELRENVRFLSRHADHPCDVARTEVYARSTMEDGLLRDGRALGDYRGYDYRIADPRAENAFRLFAAALYQRHFREDSILRRAQDLGFRLSLLRRFHPGLATAEFCERVQVLIREVNADTVDYLGRICGWAGSEPANHLSGSALAAAGDLRREVRARIRRQTAAYAALSLEAELRARLGRAGRTGTESWAGLPRLLGNGLAAAPPLAVLLAALTTSCETSPRVCDPPPSPVRYSTGIAPDLAATCATPDCHSRRVAAGELVLEADTSYAALVGRPSRQLPSRMLVRPLQPDSSYLINKLEGTQGEAGGTGEAMPPRDPSRGQSLAATIRQWILRGAPDD